MTKAIRETNMLSRPGLNGWRRCGDVSVWLWWGNVRLIWWWGMRLFNVSVRWCHCIGRFQAINGNSICLTIVMSDNKMSWFAVNNHKWYLICRPKRHFLSIVRTNTCMQSVKSLWTNIGLLEDEQGCLYCSWFMRAFSLLTYGRGSLTISEGVETNNSPGSLRIVPYTISAVEHLRLSLTAVLIPRSTSSRDSVHRWGLWEHLRAVFSWQWNHSTIPFAAGWYAVVHCRWIPRSWVRSDYRWDSNWLPLSAMMVDGTPNCAFHPDTSACATVSAEMSLTGKASGQCVNLSTQVSMYL